MSAITIITYIPLLTQLIEHSCSIVTKHRDKIQTTADTVWPGHTSEVSTALDNIVAGCAVFNSLIAALRIYQASH